jgi:hypothetical protein
VRSAKKGEAFKTFECAFSYQLPAWERGAPLVDRAVYSRQTPILRELDVEAGEEAEHDHMDAGASGIASEAGDCELPAVLVAKLQSILGRLVNIVAGPVDCLKH